MSENRSTLAAPSMRTLLVVLFLTVAPSALAQRTASLRVTGSHAVGLGALIDGEGFDLRTPTVYIGGVTDGGERREVRVGIEERSNLDNPDGRALFVMIEGGIESGPSRPLGGLLVG